ncbi:hypothetical protein KFE25_007379 [Diacronema lutheri]|uniref:Uncharacterized protein n=1 Tax=Diacronema lutheri TaxID=2081491 RepID=A0A8J6CF87_DIALT|nr:hypothetical protein KFE25_007379 [Diacronema lutheri]
MLHCTLPETHGGGLGAGALRLHLFTIFTLPFFFVRTIGTHIVGAQHGGLSPPQLPLDLQRPVAAGSAGTYAAVATVASAKRTRPRISFSVADFRASHCCALSGLFV